MAQAIRVDGKKVIYLTNYFTFELDFIIWHATARTSSLTSFSCGTLEQAFEEAKRQLDGHRVDDDEVIYRVEGNKIKFNEL